MFKKSLLTHLSLLLGLLFVMFLGLTIPLTLADSPMTERPVRQSSYVDIRLEKIDMTFGTIVRPGQVLTYILAYNNYGTVTATNVVMTETLPEYTSFNATVSSAGWQAISGTNQYIINLNPLAPTGHVGGFRIFAVTVDPATPNNTRIRNEATISHNDSNPEIKPADNTDSTSLTVGDVLDIRLNKTANRTESAASDTIQYSLEVANRGNKTASGIIITETVPAYTVFSATASSTWSGCVDGAISGTVCTYSLPNDLSAGQTHNATFAVTVIDPLPAEATHITNTATVADDGSQEADIEPSNNRDIVIIPLQHPTIIPEIDLGLTKNDLLDTVTPGQILTYSILYFNTGEVPANGVVITETLPAHTQFVGPATWQPISGTQAYRYEVGTLINNATSFDTITFVVQVEERLASDISMITNTAQIGYDGLESIEPNLTNNHVTETTVITSSPVVTVTSSGPDLHLLKVDGGVTAQPGSQVTYGLVYANNGSRPASGIYLTELLPAHTVFVSGTPGWQQVGATNQYVYEVGDLDVGEIGIKPITISMRVEHSLPITVATLENIALIADDGQHGPDENLADNLSTTSTPIINTNLPDLYILKEDDGVVAEPGEVVGYRLTFFNNGGRTANSVILTETVPAHTTFHITGSLPTEWSCADGAPAGTVCTYQYPRALQTNNDFGSEVFAVRVDETVASTVKQIVNRVDIADLNYDDPTPLDNRSSVATDLVVPTSEPTPTATPTQTPSRIATAYLPLLMKSPAQRPDLVVQEVYITDTSPSVGQSLIVEVTIENLGGPVEADSIWVDLYIARQPIEPAVNRNWEQGFDMPDTLFGSRVVPHGIAWRLYDVGSDERLTLSNLNPNDPHDSSSNYSNFIPHGLKQWPQTVHGEPVNNYFRQSGTYYLYVLVDSFALSGDSDGTAVESNEENNLFGPLVITVE
ncbi:DUF11 domain-containing protein [Anaerolineales bacterium HSG6]|nr:DUF11 domain-containing protein [Anaerolineales bacterium HSG6]